MSKTIIQLSEQAAQIQEAVLNGENTADRVGGLFSDIVDYLRTLELSDISLGPLLTALNNSNLLEPSDGQTLVFSVMGDKWTYSSQLTQLKIALDRIEQLVASNYESFEKAKKELQSIVDEVDKKVQETQRGYAEDQLAYATWKSQTDYSISQFALAMTVDGKIVSMSSIIQTCDEIRMEVIANKENADQNYSRLTQTAEEIRSEVASNKASAESSISQLIQTAEEIRSEVAASKDGVDTAISQIRQTAEEIRTQVTTNKALADQAFNTINNETLPELRRYMVDIHDEALQSSTWISQNRNQIALLASRFDSNGRLVNTSGLVTTAEYAGLFQEYMRANGVVGKSEIMLELTDFVDENGVKQLISEARISADRIAFDLAFDWEVTSGGKQIFHLDNRGNLSISGKFNGEFDGTVTFGSGNQKMYIEPTLLGTRLVGRQNDTIVLSLGFESYGITSPSLWLGQTRLYEDHLYMFSPNAVQNSYGSMFHCTLNDNSSSLYLDTWSSSSSRLEFRVNMYGSSIRVGAVKNSGVTSGWPTSKNDVLIGEIYSDSGTLKVRES